MGLEIDYRAGEVGALRDEGPRFDLVTAMEVVEHVSDVPAFIAALAALVKPDGLVVLSTPNRTAAARLAMITLGEGLKMIPRGTHDWSSFLTPDVLERSEEHTSELQSLMRISYDVFCLKKKKHTQMNSQPSIHSHDRT